MIPMEQKLPFSLKGDNLVLYFIHKQMDQAEIEKFQGVINKMLAWYKVKNNPKLSYQLLTKVFKIRSVRDGFHQDRVVVGIFDPRNEANKS